MQTLYFMRVTFLTHYPQLYGANRSLLDLIDGLRAYGVHSSVIVSGEGRMVEELIRRGIEVRVIRLGRWASRLPKGYGRMPISRRVLRRCGTAFGQLKTNLNAAPAVVRQLRAWRSDVVYSNSSLLLSGAIAARYLRIPHIWHLREFGDLDYGFVPDLGRGAQRWFINRADGIIAISKAIRNYYQPGASSHFRIVYSGIGWEADIDKLRERSVQHSADAPYTFALVGLLHPAKGQEGAIKALHELVTAQRNVRLVLAGSGPSEYRRKLEELVQQLGLGHHVEFRGFTDDVYSVYLNADAVLMCSPYEAMGRVTAEAMAACRPVIGFRSAGTTELVKHGETGLLYEGGSAMLAASMTQFLNSPEWARTLGLNGWQRARDLFTIERYAAGVFEVLRPFVSNGAAQPRHDPFRNNNRTETAASTHSEPSWPAKSS